MCDTSAHATIAVAVVAAAVAAAAAAAVAAAAAAAAAPFPLFIDNRCSEIILTFLPCIRWILER